MDAPREQFRPADHPHEHFLLTTTVGSYPKPAWLERTRERHRDAGSGDDTWAEAADDAARLITGEHERTGLDVVADGEMRRNEMVEYFMHRVSGTTFDGPVKVWGHNCFEKPTVVEPIECDEPWLEAEFEFARRVATRPVKVPITGPYTLARFSFDEVYEDTEALAYELADVVRTSVRALVDAGARYVQIDEPALAQVPGDHEIVGRCLDRIVADLPEDVRVGLHVCYGDYARIYPAVLEYPIDELDVELANVNFDQLEVFDSPSCSVDFAPGVVDTHDATIESVDEIKRNVERVLEIVPPRRLTITPDCGLKLLPREVARTKVEHMVTAAREIEAALDAGELQPGAG